MLSETPAFRASDGTRLHLYVWRPQEPSLRGVVQIAHGMGEHAARYEEVARALVGAHYAVYANDHRGHGRTADGPQGLGELGKDGWNRCVQDQRELNDRIAAEHPGVPRILLGHSMGALIAHHYLCQHGATLAGAALSGTPAGSRFALWLPGLVARVERRRLGPAAQSALLAWLLFAQLNRDFEPARTPFDWLSRDPDQVDRYVADPLCGFVLRVQSLIDMFRGVGWSSRRANLARIPKDLPVYVFSGDRDPVHQRLRGLWMLLDRYQKAGLRNVTHRFYPDARHEVFNETNRAEVLDDLLDWLRGIA
jgi:alpha-beta hydrolase superfamily lysophospholipase